MTMTAATAVQSTTALITGVGLNDGVLQIVGTAGKDNVAVKTKGKHKDQLEVKADFLPGKGHKQIFDITEVDSLVILLGGAGDDKLKGGKGEDLLVGGPGDDDLKGEDGNDILIGGAGDDKLKGGKGDDVLLGGPGNDDLKGEHGDDILLGGAGDDKLKGGKGDDVLLGGPGNDDLKGEHGDDILLGGVGADRLKGGKGDDVLLGIQGDGIFKTDGGKKTLEQDCVAISNSDLDNMPFWLRPFLLNLADADDFDNPNNNIAVILRKEDG